VIFDRLLVVVPRALLASFFLAGSVAIELVRAAHAPLRVHDRLEIMDPERDPTFSPEGATTDSAGDAGSLSFAGPLDRECERPRLARSLRASYSIGLPRHPPRAAPSTGPPLA
jgi:hypothetical protein